MIPATDVTPDEIFEFWFPDGPEPEAEQHWEHWRWRMRGGANDAIIERYAEVTERAAEGEFDHWAETPRGRLALIILLDQFPRSVWAGRARAFSVDPKALSVCLEGLENGHFDALENVWFKSVYSLPLTHCECENHMGNLPEADQSNLPESVMVPPVTVPLPVRYFVVEFTTSVAPCSMGRQR